MKRILAFTLALVMLLTLPVYAQHGDTRAHSCPAADYIDKGSFPLWAHKGIDFCIAAGIMGSTSRNALVFEPDSTMTRAQIATILWRRDGSEEAETAADFLDTRPNMWYSGAVNWANEIGLMTGTAPMRFEPDTPMNRESFAVILYRYAAIHSYDTSAAADLAPFADSGLVHRYAETALSWAVAEGLILGAANGDQLCLDPAGTATRAQAATILMRFCEKIETQTPSAALPPFSVFPSIYGNTVEFDAIAGVSVYAVYRKEALSDPWEKIGTVAQSYNDVTPQRNAMFRYIDRGVTGPYYYTILPEGAMEAGVSEPIARQAPEKLLVCVGDSLTQGLGVFNTRRQEAWPALVEEAISDSGWGVLNCGYSGASAEDADEKPYYGSRFYTNSRIAQGDMYIIMLGANDATFTGYEPQQFKADLLKIVRTYTAMENEPEVYICLPPASFRSNRRERVYAESIFPIIREIALEEGLTLIDMHTPTLEDKAHFPDLLHPDAEENRKMAQIVLDAIEFF